MSIRVLLLLLALVSLPACSSRPDSEGAPRTKPSVQETAWKEIRAGALLVDVRTQVEFDAGHLEGALLIPHDQIASRASELGDDKNRPIVLYCRTGNRSGQAKRALGELGFTNVLNAGGYETLKQAR